MAAMRQIWASPSQPRAALPPQGMWAWPPAFARASRVPLWIRRRPQHWISEVFTAMTPLAPSLSLQKFVSTTLRPTLMPYPELYNWDSCAQFVSDFLTMVPLPDPLKPVSATHRLHA